MRGKIEVEFEDLGERALKNVTEPVRVYRIAGDRAMSLSLLKFAGQASLVDEAMLPS